MISTIDFRTGLTIELDGQVWSVVNLCMSNQERSCICGVETKTWKQGYYQKGLLGPVKGTQKPDWITKDGMSLQ